MNMTHKKRTLTPGEKIKQFGGKKPISHVYLDLQGVVGT